MLLQDDGGKMLVSFVTNAAGHFPTQTVIHGERVPGMQPTVRKGTVNPQEKKIWGRGVTEGKRFV